MSLTETLVKLAKERPDWHVTFSGTRISSTSSAVRMELRDTTRCLSVMEVIPAKRIDEVRAIDVLSMILEQLRHRLET